MKQGVSRRLIGAAEHFWQKRYYDFNIRNHEQFVEKLRYLHRNPVQRWNYPTQAKRGLEWATRLKAINLNKLNLET